MGSAYRYNAFISYRHREPDETVARRVQAMLESFRAPKGIAPGKSIGKIFRDTSELPTSGDLDNALKEALASSEYLIVVLSEATKESRWCMAEIRSFREMHGGRTDHILPVLVSGEPGDVIPDLLRYEEILETLPDGTEKTVRQEKEPICADVRAATARKQRNRLKTEVLRLAAPLLGCGFDDLYQRHRKRRRRRTAAILAVCATVVIGFVGMILRNNAQIRRKNAELGTANQTLTEQQRELLVRESSLLTESAAQALRDGDKLRAMREALAALPDRVSDESRPLYAPAEGILWQLTEERINKTGDTGKYTFSTIISQETDIERYGMSSDSRYAYTLDWHGTVRCFNTFTGQVIWATDAENNTTSFQSDVSFNLLIAEKHHAVLVQTLWERDGWEQDQILSALDMETGSVLWSFRIESLYRGQLVLSPDEDYLAYFAVHQSTYTPAYECYLFDLRNGIREDCPCTVYAPEGDRISHTSSYYVNSAIAFDPDAPGTVVGIFSAVLNQTYQWRLFVMNGQEQRNLGTFPTPVSVTREDSVYEICYAADLGRIWFVTNSKNNNWQADVWCIDAENGSLLWHLPLQDEGHGSYRDTHILYDRDTGSLVVGRSGCLYLISPDDGSLLGTASVYYYAGDTGIMHALGGGLIEGLTSSDEEPFNGIAWIAGLSKNGITITSGEELGISLLNYGSGNTIYGRGILDADWNDDHTALVPRKGDGFVAYQAGSVYNQIVIGWNQSFPDLWQERIGLSLDEGEFLIPIADDRIVLNEGETIRLMVQNVYGIESENGKTYPSRMISISPDSLEVRETAFPFRQQLGQFGPTYYRFLPVENPDGILIDSCGCELSFFDSSTGEIQTLFQMAEEVCPPKGNYLGTSILPCDILAAWQDQDSTPLGAACDGNSLLLWQNGTDLREIPLPENMIWQTGADTERNHALITCSNGYVLLSAYPGAESSRLSAFACYDVSAGTWHMIADEAKGTANRLIVSAHRQPLFAVLDDDRTIRIYDAQRESCLYRLPLAVPDSAVDCLGFSDDDRYLFLCSSRRLMLYSMETGVLVYSGDFSYTLPVQVIVDPDSGRVFACCGDEYAIGNDAVIIDPETWTQITAIQDVHAFLPETGLMLKYYSLSNNIRLVAIPSVQDFIDAAQSVFSRLKSSGLR